MTYEAPQWLMWVLIVIGFAIAITLTYHELRTQKLNVDQQVDKLLNAKPSISVSLETNYGNLRVVNNGNIADFRATAQQIEKGQPIGEDWFIKWENSLEIDQKIYKGESYILEVASCEWETRFILDSPQRVPFIRFPRGNRREDMETGQQIFVYHRDLSSRYKSIQVEVSIFSTPAMRSPFKRRYLLKLIPDDDTVSIEEAPAEIKNEL